MSEALTSSLVGNEKRACLAIVKSRVLLLLPPDAGKGIAPVQGGRGREMGEAV